MRLRDRTLHWRHAVAHAQGKCICWVAVVARRHPCRLALLLWEGGGAIWSVVTHRQIATAAWSDVRETCCSWGANGKMELGARRTGQLHLLAGASNAGTLHATLCAPRLPQCMPETPHQAMRRRYVMMR